MASYISTPLQLSIPHLTIPLQIYTHPLLTHPDKFSLSSLRIFISHTPSTIFPLSPSLPPSFQYRPSFLPSSLLPSLPPSLPPLIWSAAGTRAKRDAQGSGLVSAPGPGLGVVLQAPYKAINQPETSLTIYADILINESAMLAAYAEGNSTEENSNQGNANGDAVTPTTPTVPTDIVVGKDDHINPTLLVNKINAGEGEGPKVDIKKQANDRIPRDCVIPILSIDKGTELASCYPHHTYCSTLNFTYPILAIPCLCPCPCSRPCLFSLSLILTYIFARPL